MNKQNDVSFEQANIITIDDAIDEDYISYDELDKEIEKQLEIEFKDLEQLKCDRQSIGDPKKITNAISQIVWEQFILQVAGTAGSDFIKENHDLNLSLKKVVIICNLINLLMEKCLNIISIT